jgi:cephalosporin hydroxylase
MDGIKMSKQEVVNKFHEHYYYSNVWVTNTTWMGVPTQKCPLDLWVYQELIHSIKPDVIIETGTCYGGSALFMANICELIGRGKVITIDIACRYNLPEHERILYVKGSSVDPAVLSTVDGMAKDAQNVMVVLDSDHSCNYVLREMNCYAKFVTPKSYMIVEDTDVNGHPICPDHGAGPFEAVNSFLEGHPEFEIDLSCEKFLMTQNPRGYLKKK